jgi:ABC-type sugar transport system substrate-binding protein
MKSEIIAKTLRRHRLLVAALLLAAASAPAAATDVGRLFYTPQQRAELDHKRATNAVEAEVASSP